MCYDILKGSTVVRFYDRGVFVWSISDVENQNQSLYIICEQILYTDGKTTPERVYWDYATTNSVIGCNHPSILFKDGGV